MWGRKGRQGELLGQMGQKEKVGRRRPIEPAQGKMGMSPRKRGGAKERNDPKLKIRIQI